MGELNTTLQNVMAWKKTMSQILQQKDSALRNEFNSINPNYKIAGFFKPAIL
jgi:hypothetical protein